MIKYIPLLYLILKILIQLKGQFVPSHMCFVIRPLWCAINGFDVYKIDTIILSNDNRKRGHDFEYLVDQSFQESTLEKTCSDTSVVFCDKTKISNGNVSWISVVHLIQCC
eukprot:486912_1